MSFPKPALYDKETLGRLAWPASDDGEYARRYLVPLLQQSAAAFIPNVATTMAALTVSGKVLPVTINDADYGNAYVCSPYTHYVSYARQELYLLSSAAARAGLGGLLSGLGGLLRAVRFNRMVQVNNWLLSTNLYPALEAAEVKAAVELLLDTFPTHTLMFRSLCRSANGPLMALLEKLGFRFIPSRQIYWLHPSDESRTHAKARWLVKRDAALIGRNGYELIGPEALTEGDVPRLEALYRLLYVNKYSIHNPQFNSRFFRLVLSRGLLKLHALRERRSGRLDGVLGYFSRNGVMTTPVFGYDTTQPQAVGLYRMLSASLIALAREEGLALHESSGAAQFKRNRGATAEIEYSAVYDRHLAPWRRTGWTLLHGLLNRYGVPLMEKYKL